MNGNIQVEPTRVKLDKQGATAVSIFFLHAQTVDAIVRPQLTKHISIQSLTISIQSGVCCFVATGKMLWKISGMREWAPPFPILSSPTPPRSTG